MKEVARVIMCRQKGEDNMPKVMAGRKIGDEVEYVLDENNNPIVFENKEKARKYLLRKGVSKENMRKIIYLPVNIQKVS